MDNLRGNPWGILNHRGILAESLGILGEFLGKPWGILEESLGNPFGILVESLRNPWKNLGESLGNPALVKVKQKFHATQTLCILDGWIFHSWSCSRGCMEN